MLIEINAEASWEHWPVGHLTVWWTPYETPACFYLATKVDRPQLGFPCHGAVPSHHFPPLPSNPKLTDVLLAHTSSSWCFEVTQIAQPGFWQRQAFSSSLHWPARRGEGLFFATPPGHAATEALQVWLLQGAVVGSCLTARDPGHPAESGVLPWKRHSITEAAEDLSLKLFRWGLSGLMLNTVFLYSS